MPDGQTNVGPVKSTDFEKVITTECNMLDSKQQEIVAQIMNRKYNVFINGEAGTGKSTLLKVAIKCLAYQYGFSSLGLMCVTKSAANNIHGNTIHSTLGLTKESLAQQRRCTQ